MVGMFIGWFYKKFMFVLLIGSYKQKKKPDAQSVKMGVIFFVL